MFAGIGPTGAVIIGGIYDWLVTKTGPAGRYISKTRLSSTANVHAHDNYVGIETNHCFRSLFAKTDNAAQVGVIASPLSSMKQFARMKFR